MGTIALEGLEFFAYHGFFEEERKIGNKYGVDIIVQTEFDQAAQTDNLDLTVNYVVLYQITEKVMLEPAKLLEHIGLKIIQEVRVVYPHVELITIKISKFNPPIGGICTRAQITMHG
jgi:dihydroneopterin aldolase